MLVTISLVLITDMYFRLEFPDLKNYHSIQKQKHE